jgi:hypothetical protein
VLYIYWLCSVLWPILLKSLDLFYFTRQVLTKLSRNSLKVPKIKNILLYEMKFLVPNYSCLQNPWLGGYRPQIPVLFVLNWICWNPPNKIPGYATAWMWVAVATIQQLTTKIMLKPSYWTAFTSKTCKWADSWVSPPHQMGYLGLTLLTMGSVSYFSLSLSSFMCINRCNKTATSQKTDFNKNWKK